MVLGPEYLRQATMAEKAAATVTCPSATKSVETQLMEARSLFPPAYWDRQSPDFKDLAARIHNGHQILEEMGFHPPEPRLIAIARQLRLAAEAKGKTTKAQRTVKVEASAEMETETETASQAPKAAVNLGARPAKLHRCGECGKGFRARVELQAHLRLHSKDKKPYRCTPCGLGFDHKGAFTRHNKRHSKKVPNNKCSACEQSFDGMSDLNRHKKLGCGKMPYKCSAPGCSKTYIRAGPFAKHVRAHGDVQQRSKTQTKT